MLQRHGYETYLDLIMSGPQPDGDSQADLLDALRVRRVAEDTLAALQAAAEPPAILTALRVRRDRIYREAADLLGCDPGVNVAELLYAHPVVPPARTRALASVLATYGVNPVGVSVREAAVSWLVEQDQELMARGECRREIERLDRDLEALDEEDVRAADEAQRVVESAEAIAADLDVVMHRVRTYEEELNDRARRTSGGCSGSPPPSSSVPRSRRSPTPSSGPRTSTTRRWRRPRPGSRAPRPASSVPPRRCPTPSGGSAGSPRHCPRRCALARATTRSASCPGCGRPWRPRSTAPRSPWPRPPTTSSAPAATSTRPRPSWTTTSPWSPWTT